MSLNWANIIFVFVVWSLIQQVGAYHGCYHPGKPQHTVIFASSQVDEFGRYRVGTEVTFQCERGYDLVFNEARKCQQFGSWSGVEPICAVNVARKAIKVSTLGDEIHAVANINDGFYSMCSTFQKTKQRFLSWWIDLPETVNLTAIKVAFVEQEDFINDYQIKYPASTSTTGQPLNFVNTMAWTENIYGKEISVIVEVLDKTKIVSTRSISVNVEKPSANLNGSLCEVGIYSSSEASDDLCNDTTTFNKFLVTTYNGRCFYVATGRITFVNFEDAEKACIEKNARIAELDANAFDYLNTFMVRSGYTRTIRWVSKKSAYIYTKSEKFKTGDCPALSMQRRYSKPYNCKEKYVYICEKELAKCGIPDQNKITEMKWDESGPTVTYSCPKGFKLIGSEKRDCVAGKWTGSAPVCEVKCGSPDQNNITEMQWINETKVNYSCPEGFKLIGNEQRDCVEGMWTGSSPSCQDGSTEDKNSSNGINNHFVFIIIALAIGAAVIGFVVFLIKIGIRIKKQSKELRLMEVELPAAQPTSQMEPLADLMEHTYTEIIPEPQSDPDYLVPISIRQTPVMAPNDLVENTYSEIANESPLYSNWNTKRSKLVCPTDDYVNVSDVKKNH